MLTKCEIPVSNHTMNLHALVSNKTSFLADRTKGRAYATVLRLSVVCDVMYCG